MPGARKLHLILCWHMHQPDYRDALSGEFRMPWTYLHAIKDYTDMAYHLENHAKAKVVFNFVPILLDQLEDYDQQFTSGKLHDPLLRFLIHEDMERLSSEERAFVLERCFHSNHTKMIHPYPGYQRLHDLFKTLYTYGEQNLSYLSGQYLADLITWYHLAWMGESVRRTAPLVPRLMEQEGQYNLEDRRAVFNLIGELIHNLIGRYAKLAASHQIEISTTPHYHPILPLLIDFESARESQPETILPESKNYPGGIERAKFHVQSALKSHSKRFNQNAQGMWPAEGGVSTQAVRLFAEGGCRWSASSEAVLAHSLHAVHGSLPDRSQFLYRPYRIGAAAQALTCFFRDDHLSDLIGFEYSSWWARDAAHHFVHELEQIWQRAPEHESPVVSVILDGENAWEYYPYNGYYFLSDLYDVLLTHPYIRMTTFSDYLASAQSDEETLYPQPGTLDRVVAGSWVYGNFSTWMGSAPKNRAWDMLCRAKTCYDEALKGDRLGKTEKERAAKLLAICESSDWFWWHAESNPSISVASFDALYRANLASLYQVLKSPPPADLDIPLCVGSGQPESGGIMRRAF